MPDKTIEVTIDGYVITGGQGPDFSLFPSPVKYPVVAADSGLDFAIEHNLPVDYIIGDLDSVKAKDFIDSFADEKKMVYPREKDYTDTELAIRFLKDKGCNHIELWAGSGGRLDHLLNNLALFEEYPQLVSWRGDTFDAIRVSQDYSITNKQGMVLSFYPIGVEPVEVDTKGLRWELTGLPLTKSRFSLSNYVRNQSCHIKICKGELLVIFPRGAHQ